MQKSRINRLIEDDRNTTFHHMSTIVMRRRNKISCIKNDMGEWIQSEVGAINHIRRGFEQLFTTSLNVAPLNPIRPSWWLAGQSDEDRSIMNGMVTDAKIKDDLWALKAFKALCPNGLHASFFQRFWLIVGDSVKVEVRKTFLDCKIPEYLNRTNVLLIPKMASPESLGNYRPISLCNTVYKIVTKILVVRIRPHLDKLVSPLQSAFVLRRRSADNAIMV